MNNVLLKNSVHVDVEDNIAKENLLNINNASKNTVPYGCTLRNMRMRPSFIN
jgi:hypothetical protein